MSEQPICCGQKMATLYNPDPKRDGAFFWMCVECSRTFLKNPGDRKPKLSHPRYHQWRASLIIPEHFARDPHP